MLRFFIASRLALNPNLNFEVGSCGRLPQKCRYRGRQQGRFQYLQHLFWPRYQFHRPPTAFWRPCSKLQGMFCLTVVLRSDCKEFYHFFYSLAFAAARCGECARWTAGKAPHLVGYIFVASPFLFIWKSEQQDHGSSPPSRCGIFDTLHKRTGIKKIL